MNADVNQQFVNHDQLQNAKFAKNFFALVLTKKPVAQSLNVKSLSLNVKKATFDKLSLVLNPMNVQFITVASNQLPRPTQPPLLKPLPRQLSANVPAKSVTKSSQALLLWLQEKCWKPHAPPSNAFKIKKLVLANQSWNASNVQNQLLVKKANTCLKLLPLLVNVALLSSVFLVSPVLPKIKLSNVQSLKNLNAVSVNVNRPLAS